MSNIFRHLYTSMKIKWGWEDPQKVECEKKKENGLKEKSEKESEFRAERKEIEGKKRRENGMGVRLKMSQKK